MQPLDQIPRPALLLRIAYLLNVAVQDVFTETILPGQVSGFYLKRENGGVRVTDYIISRADYYTEKQAHSPGQPPASELMVTNAQERADNEKARRACKRWLLPVLLGAWLALMLLLWAFLKFNKIIP